MENYEIISKLGCGSYGQALKAKEKQGSRNCVIKEIKVSHLDLKDLESAKKEVKVLSSLLHSHITKFFDSFESNECLYIVMEYCGGGDLQKLIDSRNGVHFPENRILDWFTQLCLAVRFIHQRHIIHRDIKAQNVFLTDEGRVKLGDFGIAKILDRTTDLTNTCIGTPYYLSPEMCENKPYSNKSDIWAVGCVLYEMAALKHAFDACNMKSLVIKIIKCSYPPLPPRYSRDLKQIVQQIFQRYPKCRPSVNSILTKTLVSKRLTRFITEEEAMELKSRKVITKKSYSTLTKRNALISRIGISSPAAKYVNTPKMNVSYPNVTCTSKSAHSPKVNLHLQTKSFLDVYKNPLQVVAMKKVNNVSFEDPSLSSNKIKKISLKKRCYSNSPKLTGKTKNGLSPCHENKPYIKKSLQLQSNSDRQSKLNLIINESSNSFKKIDVSSSILSNLNKLECSLGQTDLQHSSGWLVDFYLSKRLSNLKNDLKSSGHLSDTTKVSGTHIGLSEILSDIQHHKYYSSAIQTNVNRPTSTNVIHDNVNFIVNEEIEKACLMAENRRKLAYDEEKYALESTLKNSALMPSNNKNSEFDMSFKGIEKPAILSKDICRNLHNNLERYGDIVDSDFQFKLNSSITSATSFVKESSNVELHPRKSNCNGSFFDNVDMNFEDGQSFEGSFQQNRKQWSNGPNDIVSILSSAKLLDARNSMVSSGRQTLTKSNIVVTDPISFYSSNNKPSGTIIDKNIDANCITDVKKLAMGKTFNISSPTIHLSGNEDLYRNSITENDICSDAVAAKPIFSPVLTGMNQNRDLGEIKPIMLEKKSDHEIYDFEITPDSSCKVSSISVRNELIEVNCVENALRLVPAQNDDVLLCSEKLKEHEPMLGDLKRESGSLIINEAKYFGMHKEEDNQELHKFKTNSNVIEADHTLVNKKPKKKMFSFLHSRCTSVPDESSHKTESPNSNSKEFSTPRSKARFSAILRKFLLRESLEKCGNTCKPLQKNIKKKLDLEEIIVQPLLSEINSDIVLHTPEKNAITNDSAEHEESSKEFHSEHPLIRVNDNDITVNDFLLADVKMNVTRDSGVDSSHTHSTLGAGTNSCSLQRFLNESSNLKSLQNETVSDVGCDTLTTCSPIPIDVKYISGLEITLCNDSIHTTTFKPMNKQDINCGFESGKNLCQYSPIISSNFENAFKPMIAKERSSDKNNEVFQPNCSNDFLTNEDSLRKTAFTIVEDAFRSAIKKLEEKHFTLNGHVNEDSFCSEFKPCNTLTQYELKDNNNPYYKFDHHKNVNLHSIDASSKYVDKIHAWSCSVENESVDRPILNLEKIISTQSTPIGKNYSENTQNSPILAEEKLILASTVTCFETKLDNEEINDTTEMIRSNHNSSCKNKKSTSSDSDVDEFSCLVNNAKDAAIIESNSVQNTNDNGPAFIKGNWIQIHSLNSSISDDAQDVTNFRQSLENLLFSGDDEVFKEEALQMSVCSDSLEVDIIDGDVHGWIEELRAKLEDILGLEMFMEAYRCLECAFELNNSNLKEALCHVKKMIGPSREQMANDILQLIVTESVHLN